MSLTINTNTASLNAQRALGYNTRSLNNTLNKLSSGLRINKAADDAAGLAIAQRLTSGVRGDEAAIRNIGDGQSLANTAESSLSAIGDGLQRMRELAVQANNGTNGPNEKAAIQQEIGQIQQNINDFSAGTSFNGIKLLDGSNSSVTLQSGSGSGQTTNVALTQADTTTLGVAGVDATAGPINLASIDAAIDQVSAARSTLGASSNALDSLATNLSVSSENRQAARSRIQDSDFAAEVSRLKRDSILQQAAALGLGKSNRAPDLARTLLGV